MKSLPTVETFVLPEDWRPLVFPRQRGLLVERPVLSTAPETVTEILRAVETVRPGFEAERAVSVIKKGFLGPEVAGLTLAFCAQNETAASALVDSWVSEGGLQFAINNFCEAWNWVGYTDITPIANWYYPFLFRLRRLLATANSEDYEGLRHWAIEDRELCVGELRMPICFLFPTERRALRRVINRAPEQLNELVWLTVCDYLTLTDLRRSGFPGPFSPIHTLPILPSLLDAVASQPNDPVDCWLLFLDEEHSERWNLALSCFAQGKTLETLLERQATPGAKEALLRFLRTFPRTSATFLAGDLSQEKWTRRLLNEYPDFDWPTLGGLNGAQQQHLRHLLEVDQAPRAELSELPEVLRTPPTKARGGAVLLPDWCRLELLAPPKLAANGKKLSEPAVRNLLGVLALSAGKARHPSLGAIRELLHSGTRADFAWSLFQAWLHGGAPSKDRWPLRALGWLGNDQTVRQLVPLLKAWPGEGVHRRAVTGLEVLRDIGTDLAMIHLFGLSQRRKPRALAREARERLQEIATARGLSREQLSDRLVPTFGLDEQGADILDYGRRTFTITFDEQLRPEVKDQKGNRLRTLPRPGVKDDSEKARAAYQRFKELKKDVREVASAQRERLELAMCSQRRWSTTDYQIFLLGHPLVAHLCRRLIWAVYEQGTLTDTFRVCEDLSLADASDEPYQLLAGHHVGVVHPFEMSSSALAAWGELFSDYELLQPFEQLSRPLERRSPEEEVMTEWTALEDQPVTISQVLGLERRGWRKGTFYGKAFHWMAKELGEGRIAVLEVIPGINMTLRFDFHEPLTLGKLYVTKDAAEPFDLEKQPFGVTSELAFSELMRDLRSLEQ